MQHFPSKFQLHLTAYTDEYLNNIRAQRKSTRKDRNRSAEEDSRLRHEKDFLAFDINQDGFVDASEVRAVHKNLKQEDISAFFIAADKNEDGLITLEEYVNASLAEE